jgi:hypothetical protein
MGTIKTTNIEPIADNGTVTLGGSGDTFTVPSGVTVNMSNATQTGVGGVNTPIVSLSMPSNQITTDATPTLVALSTVDVDTDSAYTNTAGNYKFTVPSGKAGTYMITFMATSFNENSATTMVIAQIYKNGSAISAQRQRHDGRRHEGTTTHWVGTLAVGDYIQFYYYHDTTSADPQLLSGTQVRATITRLIS